MAVVYCNRCGCENSEDRGACIMCLNFLRWPLEGNICPACGGDNASAAEFCASCGEALGENAATEHSLAAAVSLVLGGAAAEEGFEEEGFEEEGFVGEEAAAEPPSVPEVDFEEPEALPEPALEAPPEPAFEEPEPYEPVQPLAEELEAPEAPPPPPAEPAEPWTEQAEEEVPEFEELAIELEAPEEPAQEEEEEEEADLGGWTIERDKNQGS